MFAKNLFTIFLEIRTRTWWGATNLSNIMSSSWRTTSNIALPFKRIVVFVICIISFSSIVFELLPWHGPSPLGKDPVARPSIWDSKSKPSQVPNRHASTNPTPILSLCFQPAWINSAKLLVEASLKVNAQNMNSFLEFHQFNQWWHVSVFVVVLINDFNCWQEIS